MEMEAAKYIGAGLGLICILGVGLALGNIFSSYINATARNPSAEPKFKGMTIIGMAVTEALGILAWVLALIMVI